MHVRYAFIVLGALSLLGGAAFAAPSVEEAWRALPEYEPGRDMAPLLVLDGEVIKAMASSEARAACAARLAGVLQAEGATAAAKKYACLQLRQAGTPAEVGVLAALLPDAVLGQAARAALEQIPGEESVAALREALGTLSGPALVGVIESLGVRRDAESVDALVGLADAEDPQIAAAALRALAAVGGERAGTFVTARFLEIENPPSFLKVASVRAAESLLASGKDAQVGKVAAKLTRDDEKTPFRRAGFDLLLALAAENRPALIRHWLASDDADRRAVAQIALVGLTDAEVKALATELAELPVDSQTAVIQASVARGDREIADLLKRSLESDDPAVSRAAIEWLTMLGDKTHFATLVERYLEGDEEVSRAAAAGLTSADKKQVGDAMLEALAAEPHRRDRVLDMLAEIRFYEAIDPLLVEAAKPDPSVHEPVLSALAEIADPDQTDLSRLTRLYLSVPEGKHREAAARTVVLVCAKASEETDRSALVLGFAPEEAAAKGAELLPLLGRLGGAMAEERVAAAMSSSDPRLREAAVLALCNWPDASVADELWTVAKTSDDPALARRALRAYVRVVTLPSERDDAETLEMLRSSMKQAVHRADKTLILERTAAVRTMGAVRWAAGYLDDAELAPSAQQCLLDLAHHKFLRNPNKAEFTPILQRIAKEGRTETLRDRAKQYLLGM